MRWTRITVGLAALIALVMIGGGVSLAAGKGGNAAGVIHACAAKRGGALRLANNCHSDERPVTWAAKSGAPTAYSLELGVGNIKGKQKLALPPGRYVFNASAEANADISDDPTDTTYDVALSCNVTARLASGAIEDGPLAAQSAMAPSDSGGGDYSYSWTASPSLSFTQTLHHKTSFALECHLPVIRDQNGDIPTVGDLDSHIEFADLVATQVGSIKSNVHF